MITSKGLRKLGFTPIIDFVLQDNSDGQGVFVAEWKSSSPQPEVSDIEAAHIQWQSDQAAAKDAEEANLSSAKIKLAGLGLTTDEVKVAFGI